MTLIVINLKKNSIYSGKYGFNGKISFFAYLLLTVFIYPLVVFALPQFKDFQNYINYIQRSDILLGNFFVLIINGSPSAIFAEPVWPAILHIMKLFFEPQMVLAVIVGFSILALSLGISKMNKKPWLTFVLILILYPLATKYFMQIRQGVAIGLYIWAYSMEGKKAITLRLLTPLIHTSLFLLLAVEGAYNFFSKINLSKRLLIAFSVSISVLVVVFIPTLVNLIKAQGFLSNTWNLNAPTISGLGVLIWGLYGIIFLMLSRPSKEVALGLTGIFVFVFSQFYIDIGSRLLPIFLPFIISSFSYFNKRNQVLLGITIAMGLILWIPTIIDPGRIFSNM